MKLFARPHEMFIARSPESAEEYVSAKIIHINQAGALVTVEMERRNGSVLTVEVAKDVVDMLELNKHDTLLVRPKQTRVFDDISG